MTQIPEILERAQPGNSRAAEELLPMLLKGAVAQCRKFSSGKLAGKDSTAMCALIMFGIECTKRTSKTQAGLSASLRLPNKPMYPQRIGNETSHKPQRG
jgi:hypothetical protein